MLRPKERFGMTLTREQIYALRRLFTFLRGDPSVRAVLDRSVGLREAERVVHLAYRRAAISEAKNDVA